MHQTVMILLVTAVITIITTVVTVRVTMTGRVLSQNAKARFIGILKGYGNIVLQVFGLTWNICWLVYTLRLQEPVTRGAVFMICLWMILATGSIGALFTAIMDLILSVSRKRNAELLAQVDTLKELEARLDKLTKSISD